MDALEAAQEAKAAAIADLAKAGRFSHCSVNVYLDLLGWLSIAVR